MKHDLNAIKRPDNVTRIYEIALDELEAFANRIKIVAIAGAKVIKHTNAVAAFYQGARKVRTDETRAAGY